MLEEALKRSDTSGAKEIGWRRWSAREGQQRELRIEEERPKSLDDGTLNKGAAVPPQTPSSAPSSAAVVSPTLPSPVPPPAVVPPAPTSQESRFFRGFRFASGSGANTPTTRASRSPTRSPSIANGASSPLNSPSLPSLIPESLKTLDTAREKEKELERQKEKEEREKKLEELTKELEKEKAAKIKATEDKTALEAEIESLSQALFEEVRLFPIPDFNLLLTYFCQANKMVAHERIKRAEAEDELREAKQEKEALRSALKLVEGENGRLRIVEEERERLEGRRAIDLRPSDDEEEEGRRRAMDGIRDLDAEAGPSQSRSSSRIGTKSPVLTPASIAADPEEASHDRSISISPSPDEYTTPMESRSQSYSSYDEPDSDPSASIDDGDDHKHEQVPDSGATESPGTPNASAYFSPPEPNFKPSTPGSYLAEEPSPWA